MQSIDFGRVHVVGGAPQETGRRISDERNDVLKTLLETQVERLNLEP